MESMKAFFEQCLRDLHRLTGLKQYIEICNKPTESEAKEEMDTIVAGMVRVSEKFNYIPQDAQKRIVLHQIVSDPEMYALNAKMVYKWFNAVSDKYWHESGHLETNALRDQEVAPVELSDETQAMIKDYLHKLSSGTVKEVPKPSKFELEVIKNEDDLRSKGAVSVGIPFTSEKELLKRDLHRQWIAECVNPITGKLIEDKLDEREWLLGKGYILENGVIKEI